MQKKIVHLNQVVKWIKLKIMHVKLKNYGSEKISALKRGGFEVADRLKADVSVFILKYSIL